MGRRHWVFMTRSRGREEENRSEKEQGCRLLRWVHCYLWSRRMWGPCSLQTTLDESWGPSQILKPRLTHAPHMLGSEQSKNFGTTHWILHAGLPVSRRGSRWSTRWDKIVTYSMNCQECSRLKSHFTIKRSFGSCIFGPHCAVTWVLIRHLKAQGLRSM